MQNRFMKFIETLFGLDVRGLAIARISFGLLILADLFNRARALSAHYTDMGVLPRVFMESEHMINPLHWSLHLLSGELWWQIILFIVAAIFAVLLILGWKTRFVTIASWILLVSLQNANPMVLQGGDIAFRLALFWGMFVPWGAAFSFDKRRHGGKGRGTVTSLGTFAWVVSVAMIYVGSAALKSGPEWFGLEAIAVQSALHIDQFTTVIGNFARTLIPQMIFVGVTNLVFLTQLIAPLAFFVPSRKGIVRGIAALALILMHASFLPFMRLGLFPFIDIALLVPLLPSRFFDALFAKLPAQLIGFFKTENPESRSKPLLIFDVLAVFFLVLSIVVNVRVHSRVSISLPDTFEDTIRLVRLDQKWNMFSPYPLTDDGWYVMPGTLANGEGVDVFEEGSAVSYDKPKLVSADYETQRWRKYMMNMWKRKNAHIRDPYADWVCREWNEKNAGDQHLEEFQMIFVREDTDLSNINPGVTAVPLGTWECENS